ncbi:ATP-dependent Clp protease ATP-binding subunit ClpC1 [Streptomyces sp. RB5]|uniref:ATP-dependent Clp protease ATP-binding subunit ClpC1 n=1 Tax=Streptomyces smaragdinus TaxID=2585196 RepID=A0A7K0CK85_9ACTN|nr:Clp protease N-terminal domain-containing protein [Streptomyces smaragdinus]MQY13653.1 ATP-dependent Clp protease ATP-binding subunit ClpC1 [Streptomyces smaragdinus]
MFERFTATARDAVRDALVAAEEAGDREVTGEHLLRALLAPGSSLPLLAGRRADLERDLDAVRRRGGVSRADAEALASIGVDVEEIVGRIEGAHGAGALSGARRGRRVRFGREGKKTLEAALRTALRRGDRWIGAEHLLLGLLAGAGVAGEVLASNGVTVAAVESAFPPRAAS